MKKTAKILLDDINQHIDDKKASMLFLKDMGYVRSGNKVEVKAAKINEEGTDNFIVYELTAVDEPEREVPFAFLLNRAKDDGVILPFPYSKYKGLGTKATTAS